MTTLRSFAKQFAANTRGTTAIEYGLIAALIAVGAIAGMRALGEGNNSSWGNTTSKLSNAMK